MSYLVKYIPVNEKGKFIPDGATFKSDYLPFHEFVMSDKERGSKLTNGSEQEVKLFLCVKYGGLIRPAVGDNVYAEQYNHVSTIKEIINGSVRDIVLDKMPHKGTFDMGQLLKMVVEVSPKAVWVKEGDLIPDNDAILFVDNEVFNGDGKIISAIKCPTCNTYH